MASFEEEIADFSSASSEQLLQQMETIVQSIHSSFDLLIDTLTKRKQQHLDQIASIKSQYESYLKSQNSDEDSDRFTSQKDLKFHRILWRFDKTYEILLSKLGQIDVLNSVILPYQVFPVTYELETRKFPMSKTTSVGEETYSSIAYFSKNWYILNKTDKSILVSDDHGLVIKRIPIKIRDASIKTISLAVSDKYIFTWNVLDNSLLTFSHDGYLMPLIPQSVEFKRPSNLAAGKDDYLAIADMWQNSVVLLQPYLNEKHRAIGFANHDPGCLVRPNDVCFTKDNNVIVVDNSNPSIHMYTIKGVWICSFGSNQVGQELKSPKNVTITGQGYIIVSCTHGYLRVYDPNTTVGYRIGRVSSLMKEKGYFSFPTRVCCSEDGRFAVCDYYNNRVQFFNLSELLVKSFFD